MLRNKTRVQVNLTAALFAAVTLLSAACGGGEETAAGVASLADVEVAATPTPETVEDAT